MPGHGCVRARAGCARSPRHCFQEPSWRGLRWVRGRVESDFPARDRRHTAPSVCNSQESRRARRHECRIEPFRIGVVPIHIGRSRVQSLGGRVEPIYLDEQWRQVKATIGRLLQLMETIAQFISRLGVVEGEHRQRAEPPAGEQIDLRVAHEVCAVDLVERVVRCMPPPAKAATWLRRETGERRGDADALKGLIAIARQAMVLESCPDTSWIGPAANAMSPPYSLHSPDSSAPTAPVDSALTWQTQWSCKSIQNCLRTMRRCHSVRANDRTRTQGAARAATRPDAR